MTPDQRIENWTRFFAQAAPDMAEYWNSPEGCQGCAHLRSETRNGFTAPWCGLQELPCSFNPILTMRHSLLGMACMGAGFEAITPVQLELAL